MRFDQAEFAVRCEWGLDGMNELAPAAEVVIVVDVLVFTTSLEVATSRGATVFPYLWKDATAEAYAVSLDAQLAGDRPAGGLSLSPVSLAGLPSGFRLVLPSPNGAAISFAAGHSVLLAACLRNASAAARLAAGLGSTFAVIPAGERWPDGGLRPSLEDLAGAGAVIAALPGSRSPEAELAVAAWERFRGDPRAALRQCGSGKELIERGFGGDVDLAAEYDVSQNVPRPVGRGFRGAKI